MCLYRCRPGTLFSFQVFTSKDICLGKDAALIFHLLFHGIVHEITSGPLHLV